MNRIHPVLSPFLRLSLLLAAIGVSLAGCGGIPQTTVKAMPDGARINAMPDSLLTETIHHVLQPNGSISVSALRTDSALSDYLEDAALVRTEVFPSRQQLLAFWINVHNAYALDMIRLSSGVRAVDDISGFYSSHVVLASGERYSLNDISETQLVKNFREPRAFFALYDGTRSGPGLYPEAYSDARLSDQLDQQLRTFLADSNCNRLDPEHNAIYLSPIFRQYSQELETAAGSVIAFVRSFAPAAMGAWIDAHPLLKINYLQKDYTINSSDIPATHDAVQQQQQQSQPQQPQPLQPQRKQPRRSSGGIK